MNVANPYNKFVHVQALQSFYLVSVIGTNFPPRIEAMFIYDPFGIFLLKCDKPIEFS
jgi:hypothetical protein